MSPREIQLTREGQGLRVGVVAARFNEFVTARLLKGALSALMDNGVDEDNIVIAHVPGSFELPTAAMAMAQSGKYDAIVCIGAVIRGETSHFDYVSSAVTRGVGRVSLDTGIPAAFGVLTTDTLEQALVRSGGEGSNRGYDAGAAAVEMANLLKQLA